MTTTREDAAALLGAPVDEIAGVLTHEHGTVVVHRDGCAYLYADTPDADGKVGLMFLELPVGTNGKPIVTSFPVFVPLVAEAEVLPAEAEAPAGDTGDGLDGLTKDELVAYASERGVTLDKRKGADRLLAELREVLAALAAAAFAGGES